MEQEGCLSLDNSGIDDADLDRISASAQALRRINQMLEDQSKRIAQAVHHQTGAILTAVLARLEESERELAPACGSCFQEIRHLLLQVEQQLGDISYDLRPAILDRDGLLGAIRLLCDRVAGRTGIAVTLTGSIRGRLPHAVETALYRVTQEALTNAARHSHARHIRVEFRHTETVECAITDDGDGFDTTEVFARTESRGLGLVGMRERVELLGGVARIQSTAGAGTEVHVSIPVAPSIPPEV